MIEKSKEVETIKNIIISVCNDNGMTNTDKILSLRFLIDRLDNAEWSYEHLLKKENEDGIQ